MLYSYLDLSSIVQQYDHTKASLGYFGTAIVVQNCLYSQIPKMMALDGNGRTNHNYMVRYGE